MYDGYLGMNRRPFVSVPHVECYFPTGAIESARTILTRCIQRGEGPGLVIGPTGTGKTLLCLLLAEQFRRSFQVAMLAGGGLSTRRALFQAILYELGRPYRGMDEGELRLAVVDYLTSGDGSSHGMVLLVDEAHTLPLRLLDEIRLLSNLARGGQPLVRLVLAGSPVLEERFASPKLDSFNQRLSARCYLESLNGTETREYIQAQIRLAMASDADNFNKIRLTGASDAEIFGEVACQSVFQATGGVPRLVNQLCDHALLLAHVAGRRWVEAAEVEEAWADLQQLPTPWNAESADRPSDGGVIEFGSLDDSNEAAEPASANAAPRATVFRVASVEDEEEEAGDVEPARQIHRIERLLAKADADEDLDFRPAGTIGPEIELRFEETLHPFQEEFEHEEVVSDRYAPARQEHSETSSDKPLAASQTSSDKPLAASQNSGDEQQWFTADNSDEPAPQREVCMVGNGPETTGDVGRAPSDEKSTPSRPERRREYRHLFARLRQG